MKIERLKELETIVLKSGSHAEAEKQFCAMELVAYIAGEEHSDHPKCACPVITSYTIKLNDRFTESERQLLKPLLTKIVGTRDGNALKRARILAHAALTVFAPLALDAAGLKEHADKLRGVEFGDFEGGRKLARDADAAAAADAAADDAAAYAAAAYAAADAAAYAAAYAAYAAAAAAAAAAAYADDAYAAYAAAAAAAAAAAYALDTANRKEVVAQAIKYLEEIINVK